MICEGTQKYDCIFQNQFNNANYELFELLWGLKYLMCTFKFRWLSLKCDYLKEICTKCTLMKPIHRQSLAGAAVMSSLYSNLNTLSLLECKLRYACLLIAGKTVCSNDFHYEKAKRYETENFVNLNHWFTLNQTFSHKS